MTGCRAVQFPPMKRFRRWLFGGVAALSLMLCVATSALWIRSCWRQDDLTLNACYGAFTEPHTMFFWTTSVPRISAGGLYHSRPASLRQTRRFRLIMDRSQGNIFFGFLWFSYRFWVEPSSPPCRWVLVGIPLWCPLAITSLTPTIWLMKRKNVLKTGVCMSCGYDLRATPDRCPECGTVPQNP